MSTAPMYSLPSLARCSETEGSLFFYKAGSEMESEVWIHFFISLLKLETLRVLRGKCDPVEILKAGRFAQLYTFPLWGGMGLSHQLRDLDPVSHATAKPLIPTDSFYSSDLAADSALIQTHTGQRGRQSNEAFLSPLLRTSGEKGLLHQDGCNDL